MPLEGRGRGRGWDYSFGLITFGGRFGTVIVSRGDSNGDFWFSSERGPWRVSRAPLLLYFSCIGTSMIQPHNERRKCEALLLSVQFIVITAKLFL